MSAKTDPGKPDTELENGPVDKRECRDVLCCLLFIAAMVVAAVIFITGFTEGDHRRLTYVYDNSGDDEPCGLGDREDYPYLYFPDLSGDDAAFKASRVCVKECPTEDETDAGVEVECYDEDLDNTCVTSDISTGDLTWVKYHSSLCTFFSFLIISHEYVLSPSSR